MQLMFLFKLKIWNYIQHNLGCCLFSSVMFLYVMLCFISLICKFLAFYQKVNKDDCYYWLLLSVDKVPKHTHKKLSTSQFNGISHIWRTCQKYYRYWYYRPCYFRHNCRQEINHCDLSCALYEMHLCVYKETYVRQHMGYISTQD